jgi:hypothetical protein
MMGAIIQALALSSSPCSIDSDIPLHNLTHISSEGKETSLESEITSKPSTPSGQQRDCKSRFSHLQRPYTIGQAVVFECVNDLCLGLRHQVKTASLQF